MSRCRLGERIDMVDGHFQPALADPPQYIVGSARIHLGRRYVVLRVRTREKDRACLRQIERIKTRYFAGRLAKEHTQAMTPQRIERVVQRIFSDGIEHDVNTAVVGNSRVASLKLTSR